MPQNSPESEDKSIPAGTGAAARLGGWGGACTAAVLARQFLTLNVNR